MKFKYFQLILWFGLYFYLSFSNNINKFTLIAPIVSVILSPIITLLFKKKDLKFCVLFNSFALLNFATIFILRSDFMKDINVFGGVILIPLSISLVLLPYCRCYKFCFIIQIISLILLNLPIIILPFMGLKIIDTLINTMWIGASRLEMMIIVTGLFDIPLGINLYLYKKLLKMYKDDEN